MNAPPKWRTELHDLVDRLHDGEFDDADRLRLNDLLRGGAPQREYFITYMDVHSRLAWDGGHAKSDEGSGIGDAGIGVGDSGFPDFGFTLAAESSGDPPPALPLPPFPLATSHYPPTTDFVGGPVFSYMVATLILGIMLLGAWAYKISRNQQELVVGPTKTASPGERPEPVFVGRITGMADCRWADPRIVAFLGSSVPLHRRYALSAGLMEITYSGGAKVILEGPCTYQVESAAGGFLSLGKLTAACGEEVRGQRSEPKT